MARSVSPGASATAWSPPTDLPRVPQGTPNGSTAITSRGPRAARSAKDDTVALDCPDEVIVCDGDIS
jgi:hypothetical protein